jgi:hypothetical protein
METTKTRYQCRHIFTEGRRCQSPCLRQQDLCYFHQTTRPASAPPQHTHPEAFTLPMPEDRAAIQLALGHIIARIAAGTLNARRAGLLLYALQIASLNLPKAQPSDPDTQVDEITQDPTLGPLAPKAEYKSPTAEEPLDRTGRGRTMAEILMEDWHAGHPTNIPPQPEPEPGTIPDIKAVADPRHSERRRSRSRRIPKNPTPPRNPKPSNPKFASAIYPLPTTHYPLSATTHDAASCPLPQSSRPPAPSSRPCTLRNTPPELPDR